MLEGARARVKWSCMERTAQSCMVLCLVSVAVSSLPDDVVDELDLAEDEALRWVYIIGNLGTMRD